ncbi:ACSL5 [Bugula neritina]|uniref:long-chain-fatty-acid--CoA ligase n=1 Tax=Bugula neritina TaxID=10212 RepID=A0A7J7J0G9_BUGNE|nr:ACSL5 [Bugula neritina]
MGIFKDFKMDSWIVPVGTAAAVGLVGMAAVYATSDPSGYTVDVKSLLDQSEVHPVTNQHSCFKSYLLAELLKYSYLWMKPAPCTMFLRRQLNDLVLERVTNVGYGLRWLNQQPNNDTLVGVFSKNRAEMVLTQLACYQHSMVIVPMYDTLGDEGIIHIVNQTKMEVIICDDEDKIKNLLKWGHDQLPSVKTLVHMNSVGADTVAAVESQGWTILSFEKLESEGKNNPVDQMLCGPEDLCVICYTSGTTGKPKGAMIQHKGLNNVAKSSVSLFTQSLLQKDILVDGAETHISYLPLAHMYEQTVMVG